MPSKALTILCILCATEATAQAVLNEVHYDAPNNDDGLVFVELPGPLGADISGWRIHAIEGSGRDW